MVGPKGTIVLHYGPMGISTMGDIQKLMPKGAVIDTNLARMAGASFAFGAPATLDALRAKLVADALATVQATHPTLAADAQRWLAVGEQGTSSLTLFSHLAGLPLPKDRAEPRDLDDFRRCRVMLEEVPSLRSALARAADLSPAWGRLAHNWDALCASIDAERATGAERLPRSADMLDAILKG